SDLHACQLRQRFSGAAGGQLRADGGRTASSIEGKWGLGRVLHAIPPHPPRKRGVITTSTLAGRTRRCAPTGRMCRDASLGRTRRFATSMPRFPSPQVKTMWLPEEKSAKGTSV